MSLQKYFKEFNEKIKMDYDVKSELKGGKAYDTTRQSESRSQEKRKRKF